MVLIPPNIPSLRGFPSVTTPDVEGVRIAIVRGLWNEVVVSSLVQSAANFLKTKAASVEIFTVAGAFELPFAARQIQESGKFDAVIAIACLFKGETMHFEYVSQAVLSGLMDLNLRGPVPVINGVLHCLNEEQAMLRAGLVADAQNHGENFAIAALQQLKIKDQLFVNH